MVVETKFRVSRYAQDTPLSLGNQFPGSTSIYLPGAPLPWQTGRVPGINLGTPGTGGFEEYPITDPSPGSCRSGFTRNYLGQCVPIQQLPECPTGFARDSQGNCVQIPVTPVPPTPGMSAQIVKIQLPRSFIQGRVVTIRTWFQNYRADAPLYGIKINLPGISFTHETPPVPTQTVGQTVRIDSTFTVPNFAQVAIHPPPPIPGTVALLRYQQVQCVTTPCNPQLVETPDTENISLYTTGAPPTPTPTPRCPTGYTGTPPNCVKIPTPSPTPKRCSKAELNIMAKWKQLAAKFEADRARKCPGSGLGGQIQCKVATNIAAAWKKNYQRMAAKCGASASMAYAYATDIVGPASISLAPTTVPRGGNFVIEGSGFGPRELVNIEIQAGNTVSRTAQIANSSGQIRKIVRAAPISGVSSVSLSGSRSGSGTQGTVTVT